jgi:hypothetical protein
MRSHRDHDGAARRWRRLVTYADEYQARHVLTKRIPGGLHRGSAWLCEGRCAERIVWVNRETNVQVSRDSDGVAFTHEQMRARGCIPADALRSGLYL